jgi:hypothetical protein
MSDGIDYRREIKAFIAANSEMLGGLTSVITHTGENIDLNNMTDEQAKRAAEALFTIGAPTRLGALGRRR